MKDLIARLRARRDTEMIDGWERVEWEDDDALSAADAIEGLMGLVSEIEDRAEFAVGQCHNATYWRENPSPDESSANLWDWVFRPALDAARKEKGK